MAQSHRNRIEGHLQQRERQRTEASYAPPLVVRDPEHWEQLVAAATSSEPRMVALRPDIESQVLEHFSEMTEHQQLRLMSDPYWDRIIRRDFAERDVPLPFDASLLQRVRGTIVRLYQRFRQEYLRWSIPHDVQNIFSQEDIRRVLWHFDASLLEEQRVRNAMLTMEERMQILDETLETLHPLLDEKKRLIVRHYLFERVGIIREN